MKCCNRVRKCRNDKYSMLEPFVRGARYCSVPLKVVFSASTYPLLIPRSAITARTLESREAPFDPSTRRILSGFKSLCRILFLCKCSSPRTHCRTILGQGSRLWGLYHGHSRLMPPREFAISLCSLCRDAYAHGWVTRNVLSIHSSCSIMYTSLSWSTFGC